MYYEVDLWELASISEIKPVSLLRDVEIVYSDSSEPVDYGNAERFKAKHKGV